MDNIPHYEFIGSEAPLKLKHEVLIEDRIALDINRIEAITSVSANISRLMELRDRIYSLNPTLMDSFEYWDTFETLLNEMIEIYRRIFPRYKRLIKDLYPSIYHSPMFMLLHIRAQQNAGVVTHGK